MRITGRHLSSARRVAAAVLCAALLASCSASETPPSAGSGTVEVAFAAGSATYTITAGDTLSGIAARAGVSLTALVDANGWPDGTDHFIQPGDVITLPEGASTPSPAPAASAGTAGTAPAVSTTAPDAGATPIDENGFLACDGAAIRAAIGDPDFVSFDEVGCENGWAGAGYVDSENFYTPVILKAEGRRWVLQEWTTVCDQYPDMPNQAKLYCPGG
jgi:LysM repeat protein